MMEVYRASSDLGIFFLCFQRVLLNLEKSFKEKSAITDVLGTFMTSEEWEDGFMVTE